MKWNPYSVSKIKMFDECPFKFHRHYILKIRPPIEPTIFFEKGKFCHWVLEHYPVIPEKSFKFRMATKKDIADWMQLMKGVVKNEFTKKLLENRVSSEKKFSLNYQFQPIKFKKKTSVLMGYIDHIGTDSEGTYCIIDWKTGQSKVEDHLQVMAYALWFLLISPNVDLVKCGFVYLDQNKVDLRTYKRSQLSDLEDFFINKIDEIENCDNFEKKPSRKCKWCDHFNECQPFALN